MRGVLIGRASELERALDEGEGPAALVLVGDPGSGKSRLLAEGEARSTRDVFRVVGYEPERLVPLAAASEMPTKEDNMKRMLAVSAALLAAAVIGPTAAFAHPHVVSTSSQVLANGQNHGRFVNGTSCGGDPAAYGLETAHHGPDAGTPGRADGCYQTTGSVPPGQDVASPVIR